MRQMFLLAGLIAGSLAAQSSWREQILALPDNPGPNVRAYDIERVEAYARYAAPYFATLTPADYERNRELVRRMSVYLAAVDAVNRDPQIRAALGRAFLSLAAIRWLIPPFGVAIVGPNSQQRSERPTPTAPPPAPAFELQAPTPETVLPTERDLLNDLSDRYDSAAAKAASAWKSAGLLRQSLQAQGMTLHPATEISLARMQVYFDLSAESLRSKQWAKAKEAIGQAEAETEKVAKSVGR